MLTRISAQLVRGFCMGAADVVPGVSGGTVALVFGIYETLVSQVRKGAEAGLRLLRLDVAGFVRGLRALRWEFLLPLLAGIGLAVLTLASFITHQLETNPEETAAVFFGLIVASIVIAWRLVPGWDNARYVVLVVSSVVSFWGLGFRGREITDPEWYVVIGAGALAICAMILPGISGSFILLMIGLYDHVLGAVDERDLATVALFAVGAVVGLASFSEVLDRSLRNHHDTVVAGLIGLMVGSLRVLWPWPEGTDSAALASPPAGEWIWALALATIAAVALLGVAGLGAVDDRR